MYSVTIGHSIYKANATNQTLVCLQSNTCLWNKDACCYNDGYILVTDT